MVKFYIYRYISRWGVPTKDDSCTVGKLYKFYKDRKGHTYFIDNQGKNFYYGIDFDNHKGNHAFKPVKGKLLEYLYEI